MDAAQEQTAGMAVVETPRALLMATGAALVFALAVPASAATERRGQVVASQSAQDATAEPFAPTESPPMSDAAQDRMMIGVGVLLGLCALLAVSMLRGGRLGRWWYYGGKSRDELDRRPLLFSLHDSYRTRRRR